jgi:hypothetical protein
MTDTWQLVAILVVISLLTGMYIGVKLSEPDIKTCKNYVVVDCPKQDPVAWYTLTDGETVECKVDNAVIQKVMDIW